MVDDVRVGGAGLGVGAVANALARAGVLDRHDRPISDATIVAAAGGIGFTFMLAGAGRNARLVADGSARGLSPRTDLADEVAAGLGARVQVQSFGQADVALGALIDLLDEGAVVLAWVDRAALPWERLPSGCERIFGVPVGVLAFDRAAGEFLLDDRAAVPIPVDAARFQVARGQAPAAQFRLAVIRRGGAPSLTPAAILGRVVAGMETHVGLRLGNRGVAGIRTLAARIRSPAHAQSWRRAFGRSWSVFEAHLALARSIEEGVGPALGRRLFVDALRELAGQLSSKELQRELQPWSAIAGRWEQLVSTALPLAVPALGEALSLLRLRRGRFLKEGVGASAVFAAANERLAEIAREVEASFPLDASGLALLHGELAGELESIADAEEEAGRRLIALHSGGA